MATKNKNQRKALAEKQNKREKYSGIFVRYGSKKGYMGELTTVMLKDVRDHTGKLMTDHLWFNETKGFKAIRLLNEGDLIEFVARAEIYQKGYFGNREDVHKASSIDYKLSFPTKIKKITSEEN